MSKGGGVGVRGVMKGLLYAGITFFTLYMCSFIVQYGLMVLMCLLLLLVGSLLWIHVEGAYSREALWSMGRVERQLFHANHLPFFSIVPNVQPSNELPFMGWNEGEWRKVAESWSGQLSDNVAKKRAFSKRVDNYVVHGGWPTREEVERCDNTIVLSVRHSWAGLASRINPVMNAVLNKFVKCWNRNLLYCGIRVSSYGMPYPTVILDFPTADVAYLNFGQKDDCLVMSWVYDQVRHMYPTAKIIFLSVCLGGLRILNWLSRNPKPENVIGVVLESPLPSVQHLIKGFLGRAFTDEMYRIFCMLVPNFRPELENQYSFFRSLKQEQGEARDAKELCNIPIFVGMLEADPFSNKSHIPLLTYRFPNMTIFTSNEEFFGNHEISHGKLYRLTSYRTAAQKFIATLQHPLKSVSCN